MLIGATVLCALVLLALLAETAAEWISGGDTSAAFYFCAGCDLRYPKRELRNPVLMVCPNGHPVIHEARGTSASRIAVCVCLGFLTLSLLLLSTGLVPLG